MTTEATNETARIAAALLLAIPLALGTGCDDGGGSGTPSECDSAAICDGTCVATNVGTTCSAVPNDVLCGDGGVCLDFGTGTLGVAGRDGRQRDSSGAKLLAIARGPQPDAASPQGDARSQC